LTLIGQVIILGRDEILNAAYAEDCWHRSRRRRKEAIARRQYAVMATPKRIFGLCSF
jgi:hypothetical protein